MEFLKVILYLCKTYFENYALYLSAFLYVSLKDARLKRAS